MSGRARTRAGAALEMNGSVPRSDTSVVDAVVHRAKTSGVALVMVAGEVVLRDGRFTRIDKAAALAELAASLRAPLTPEEEGRRRLSREVFPVVQALLRQLARRGRPGAVLPAQLAAVGDEIRVSDVVKPS